jgi:hypothetical protein
MPRPPRLLPAVLLLLTGVRLAIHVATARVAGCYADGRTDTSAASRRAMASYLWLSRQLRYVSR